MSEYSFGALHIDPKQNPAILNTTTWDEQAIKHILENTSQNALNPQNIEAADGHISDQVTVYRNSHARKGETDWYLCETHDGQNFLLSVGTGRDQAVGKPFFSQETSDGCPIKAFATTDETLNLYVSGIYPEKGPKPLGAVPRLGIGNRHSVTLWPGIWNSIAGKNYTANAIQNSVRELHRMETLINGESAPVNHLYSFGKILGGHTGSTFEGLWTAGVISALKSPHKCLYGADADHLQVKRGSAGIKLTKKYIDSARFYTFYTMDVSDILHYLALTSLSSVQVRQIVEQEIPSAPYRKELMQYHKKRFSSAIKNDSIVDEELLYRFFCKYWHALNTVQELELYLKNKKQGQEYDLELSIDETPADFSVFKAITSTAEMQFLINEIQRRQMGITHLAPNFGVEKGVDYRAPGGLPILENRVAEQVRLAADNGLMLDCHSGDDLSRNTRRAFGRASQGQIHFKVSPYLQFIYAESLEKINPGAFRIWWEDTLAYARESASAGSAIAIKSLKQLDGDNKNHPSARHLFFREYNFATVGKQDNDGRFLFRPMFYTQNQQFQDHLTGKVEQFLNECAEDLWDPKMIR